MLNFDCWIKSKTRMTVEEYANHARIDREFFNDAGAESMLVYDGSYFIADLGGGEFWTIGDREDWKSRDLRELERILFFDWYIYNVTPVSAWGQDTAHKIARDFMGSFNRTAFPMALSLDEWLIEYGEKLSRTERRVGYELLNRFEGYGGEY